MLIIHGNPTITLQKKRFRKNKKENKHMPLIVHFLNVGRGDCTIIEFPNNERGQAIIISN